MSRLHNMRQCWSGLYKTDMENVDKLAKGKKSVYCIFPLPSQLVCQLVSLGKIVLEIETILNV